MDLLLEAAAASCSGSGGGSGGGGASGSSWRRCVDLGCGTGLMAPLLRPRVGWLEGVDLSAAMVDKARARALYDQLGVAELVAYLQQRREQQEARAGGTAAAAAAGAGPGSSGGAAGGGAYDLVVAADVFVYIGNLQPVLQAAAGASAPGALIAFSTEQMQEGGGDGGGAAAAAAAAGGLGYEVQLTGRWVHSQRYLREVAAQAGWQVLAMSSAHIRKNAGKPVVGNLCVMRLQ
jgi:predicted TPR repeat methyltransferase